jgi:hypothetical protein
VDVFELFDINSAEQHSSDDFNTGTVPIILEDPFQNLDSEAYVEENCKAYLGEN